MLKYEIKEFLLNIGGADECTATVPFTLHSVMADMGLAKAEDTRERCPVRKMSATARILIDEELHTAKHTYIRVCGVHSPAEFFVNGTSVGKTSGARGRMLFDVGESIKKGENTLTIEFAEPDWDVGVFSAVTLLRFNNSIIDDVRISEAREGDLVSLSVEISSVGSSENSRGVATLISGSGQIYYGGFVNGIATIHISDPLFWNPQGFGVQNIYKLTVNLYGDAEAEDTLEFKVGLRKIAAGEDNLFTINENIFLPMGAVYVPETIYTPEVSRKRTAAFVTSAAMAGFNCFVIRGGRLPEGAFFDLCDVHGIAVIYEMTEITEISLSDVASVAHHPSFVHVDVIGDAESSQAASKIKEMIPGVDCSFVPEAPEYFGESSVPRDKVTYSVIAPEDRNVFSSEMEKHSGEKCIAMAHSAAERYLYAYTPSDFAYLTRLTQAENTKKEMLKRRISLGKDGRAVFSEISARRLISSSSLDTEAGWKALQYYAKSFFAPVTITAEANGGSVSFIAINNKAYAVFGLLESKIIDNDNKVVYKYSEEIDIAENSSRTVFTHDLSEYIASHEHERLIEYSFTEGNSTLAKGTYLFAAPKNFVYKNPDIKAEIAGADRRFSITLTSSCYAGGVEIDFADTDAVFSDNYFDITSEVPVKINFTVSSPVETAKSLKKQLKIRSLYDIGK